jgi:hypothetical protein
LRPTANGVVHKRTQEFKSRSFRHLPPCLMDHGMKKASQLGMNPSKASNRLVKDILFYFIQAAGHVCFRCGNPLSRQDFSIEHKIAWLDSDDPIGLFFDLGNIAYSHKRCNFAAGRKVHKLYETEEERLEAQRAYQRKCNARPGRKERRRAQYLRTGN